MRVSVKCSSAVHILLMIAALPASCKTTSEFLASSVGSNPVEIRKLLSSLKKAGIIDVVRGPGGARLRKKPEDISLLEIYSAVDEASLDALIGVHSNPAEQCPFGGNIARLLAKPYAEIGEAVRQKMTSITLELLLRRLGELEPGIRQEVEGYAGKRLRGTISGYGGLNVHTATVRHTGAKWRYVLFPAWVLTYKDHNGKIYTFALNGQTGTTCGKLPISKGKLWALFAKVSVPIFAIITLAGWFFS